VSQDNQNVTRRQVLAASAVGAGAAVGAGKATAAESMVGQETMTIVYNNGPDVYFDFDYYESTHMPLIMRLYGESISRFELRRGPPPAADGTLSPFVATINIWIADAAAFDAAAAEHQEGIRADVSKFTNAELVAQRDTVVAIDSR
jgi:uncharacterized protein (TIGR02118 family)